MSENQPEQPAGDTNVDVKGDAVINQAPDGGGVDNQAPAADAPAQDDTDKDSKDS